MNQHHLTSLVLEQLCTGIRTQSEEPIASHLRTCVRCRERLDALRREDQVYLERKPPAIFFAALQQRRKTEQRWHREWWRWGITGVLAAATASIAAVWFMLPVDPDHLVRGESDIRMRGTTTVQTFAVIDGALVPVFASTKLDAGARLRFRVQTPPGYVCVLHRSGDEIKPLVPESGARKANGDPWFVPGTFALTPTPVRDVLLVVRAQQRINCSDLARVLALQGPHNRATGVFAGVAYSLHEASLPIVSVPRSDP